MSPLLQIMRWIPPLCFGIALGALVYGVACAPSRPPVRLGLRGLKRKRALNDIDGWSTIEPFMRWLGARLGGILTEEQRVKVEDQITLAGDFMGLTADEYVAFGVVGAVVGGFVGYAFGWYMEYPVEMTILFGIVLGGAGLQFHLQGAAQERLKLVSRTLPYAIDLMALSMSAGLDFPGAARQVIQKSSNPNDPLVEEFTLLSQTLNLGRTRKEALMELARRNPAESVKEFASAVIQAEERGNPVAEVLLIQAGVSRTRRSILAEESAAKAATKLVLPMTMVLGVVMLLLLGPILVSLKDVF